MSVVPVVPKKYFELRLRIRYWWLWTAFAVLIVAYPIAVVYTMFSMQYFETHGYNDVYQKQWEVTGCPERIRARDEGARLRDWAVRNRWNHLLRLDDSYLAMNSQDILDDPLCLGAKIELMAHKPGPWRYDIVDTQSQKIIVSITPGK